MASWASRFHVLGVDDGPFLKRVDPTVPVVAVLMEGHDLVEAVATTSFAVDGDNATGSMVTHLIGRALVSGESRGRV